MAKKFSDEQIVNAYKEEGSYRKAAAALGMEKRNFERRYKHILNGTSQEAREQRRRGFIPEYDLVRPIPDGWKLKSVSDMRTNPEGKPIWYKFDEDKARQAELMAETIEAMKDELPRATPSVKRGHSNASLLNCYIVTDYHLGMMAWKEEAGEEWGLQLAETLLVRWFSEAIRMSPDARTGVLANLGDFLHFDGLEALTNKSKNPLDADARYQYIVRVAIRLLRKTVDMLLDKHDHVHLVMCDANHDEGGEVWLREMFAAHYDNDPRVTVDTSASTYYCFEHGQTSLFFHHGHRKKPASIDDVFVAKFREVFGRTKHSFAHMGHLHHTQALETNLMIVEQHRTLAAKDAYAAQHGYLAGRDAKVITYHKDHGEVSRLTISPEMLES